MNVSCKSVLQTRHGLHGPGFESQQRQGIFLFLKTGQTYCGGPPTLLFIRNQVPYPALKQPWREVDPSPPPNAEVKHEWSYTSTSLHAFMELTGTNLLLPLLTYSMEQSPS